MKITISNKIRIHDPPALLKTFLIEQLRIVNPKYRTAIEMGYRAVNIPPYLFNFELLPDGSIDIPRGLRAQLLNWVANKDFGIPDNVKINDDRTLLAYQHIDSRHIDLREYQYDALVELIKGGPEGLLVSKAGSGKTVMGLSLLPMLGQKMLWLTHTIPLVAQVIERVANFLPSLTADDVGLIGGGKWDIGNKFTVATIQTLVRRPADAFKMCDEFGIIIIDECHHVPASTFTQVISSFNPNYLYGLTATPDRKDGLSVLMLQTMGPVLSYVPIEAINKSGGIIVPEVLQREINYPGVEEFLDDDSYQTLVKKLYENEHRNAIIVNDVLNELNKGNVCIIVTERKAHAKLLHNMLSIHSKRIGIVTGDFKAKDNKAVLEALARGDLDGLVATSSLLGEGFDEPKINRAFFGLPIRNEVRTEQIVGRIQRPSKETNKVDAIIYDYVDPHSLFRHQFKNKGDKGCRYNVYHRLGCKVTLA